MTTDKRLSEVLTIDDLKEYGRKVCIVSGVGSGKNYWVENELTKHGDVLLVTSRKIVKDQTLTKEFFTENALWYGKNYKVCTHSNIGMFVKNNTEIGSTINETMFDYVVIDEAHALVSDSTFSDTSNYLWQFIRNVRTTVILMTATVSWIEDMIKEEGFIIIDKTDECVNLRPKVIEVITHKKVKEILKNASNYNKIIYMLPSAKEVYLLEDEFINSESRNDVVAITSSERDKNFSNSELLAREESTYKILVEENRFPDDVNILITTTKLREGVNIEDERIKRCISGCHTSVDIRQFSGRVRTGIETLYIVEDRKQNRNYVNQFEIDASVKLLPKFDEVIKVFLNWGFGDEPKYYADTENCKNFYSMIEKRFELIKFNRYDNKFELYKQSIIGCEKEAKDLESFKKETWMYLGNIFGKGINIKLANKKSFKKALKDKCILFLQEYLAQPLNSEEMAIVLTELTEIGLRNSKDAEYLKLGSAVSYLGYKLDYIGNKNDGIKVLVDK